MFVNVIIANIDTMNKKRANILIGILLIHLNKYIIFFYKKAIYYNYWKK